MKKDTMKTPVDVADEKLFDNWFDPVETELRTKVRGLIEAMIEDGLETALARPRYGRRSGLPVGGRCGRADCRPPARSANTLADRHIRTDRNRRSAGPDLRCGRQDDGMEEQSDGLGEMRAKPRQAWRSPTVMLKPPRAWWSRPYGECPSHEIRKWGLTAPAVKEQGTSAPSRG